MEPSVYVVLEELYQYTTDPNRKIFNTTDIAHLEAVLRTLLTVYGAENHDQLTPQVDTSEARRPPRSKPKQSWWRSLLP